MKKIIIDNIKYYKEDNILVTYDKNKLQFNHYCLNCGTNTNNMKLIKEFGYYTRTTIYKCKCNQMIEATD